MTTIEERQRAVDRLRVGYRILERQTQLLAALDRAQEALPEREPSYVKADELRGLLAVQIVRNVHAIWLLSDRAGEDAQ